MILLLISCLSFLSSVQAVNFPCPAPPASGTKAFSLDEGWSAHTEYQKSWYWVVGSLCIFPESILADLGGKCTNVLGFEVAITIFNASTTLISQLHLSVINKQTHYSQVLTGVPEVSSSITGSSFDLGFISPTATASFTLVLGFPGTVGSLYRLDLTSPNLTISLLLQNQNPSMYHGNGGYMHIAEQSPNICSSNYYISMARLLTLGNMVLNGKTLLVSGTSWMDSQWTGAGPAFLKGWITSFFHIGTNNVMVYLLFLDGLKLLYNSSTVEIQDLFGTVTSGKITGFNLLSTWTSPISTAVYPTDLIVFTTIPSISQIHIYVDPCTPYFQNQELAYGKNFSSSYWEGAVLMETLSSQNKLGFVPASNGYLELQGFLGQAIHLTPTPSPIHSSSCSSSKETNSISSSAYLKINYLTIMGCLLFGFFLISV